MKYKKLLLTTLMTACGATSYATAVDYKAGTTYQQGQEVNNAGSCYVCNIPGWCSSSAAWAYEPGKGTAWQEAWTEGCKDPGPSPQPVAEKTISVNLTGDSLPADAKIEFSSNGKVYTVNNNQITLPYSDTQAINYTISISGKDIGLISPDSFAMTKDTNSINLTYKAKPAPVPGKCDSIPSDVKDFIPNGEGGFWGGYSKGAFVKFDGNIYELVDSYWTSASPADDAGWKLCEAVVQANITVKTTGLPQTINKLNIKIGSELYTINPNNPEPITLGKGNYDVSAEKVLSSDASEIYVAKNIMPNPIIIDKDSSNIDLNINFEAEAVKPTQISFNVGYAEGTNPTSITATVSNTNGYKETIQLVAGANTVSLPSKGEFTIKPDGYKYNDTNYQANTLTVIDGKFKDGNSISYTPAGAWPEKSMVGYWGTWVWGQSADLADKLSQFADYYNVIVPGFVRVSGNEVSGFADAVNPDNFAEAVKRIHAKDGLVIASTGGANNTWQPTLSSDNTQLAKNIVNYLAENSMDGFDFDLEGDAIKGSDPSWTTQMQDLIGKMREYANSDKIKDKFPRGFFITAAPQTFVDTGIPASIYWTSTGGRYNIFKDMLPINACGGNICFDALLIQNYNNRNAPGWPNQDPTLSMKIAADTLKAANNTKTRIVIGDDFAPAENSYVSPQELQTAYTTGDNEGPALSSYNNFSGFMVWALGQNPSTIDAVDFGKQIAEFYPINDK
ncbi:glycosyl hydrolase family 18 protein [Francisella tularensis]|uniref:glycosyl hydrolase family 18 protein n=1 Tax=Francisella tularensis TaxID=263 RepID=UPI0015701270|nr:glycosyl hydrolase family 18 protein [Francisella tularensis]